MYGLTHSGGGGTQPGGGGGIPVHPPSVYIPGVYGAMCGVNSTLTARVYVSVFMSILVYRKNRKLCVDFIRAILEGSGLPHNKKLGTPEFFVHKNTHK